jgi:hypothetical protein
LVAPELRIDPGRLRRFVLRARVELAVPPISRFAAFPRSG